MHVSACSLYAHDVGLAIYLGQTNVRCMWIAPSSNPHALRMTADKDLPPTVYINTTEKMHTDQMYVGAQALSHISIRRQQIYLDYIYTRAWSFHVYCPGLSLFPSYNRI